MAEKVIVTNRRARRDYHVLDTYEAGIVLKGTEVKSLRAGKVHLKDSYAEVTDKGEIFLLSAHISPYEQGNIYNHDPERPRKLLLHKKEILRIASRVAEKGLTLIPLRMYFKRGRAKVELGVCKGKKLYDKRAAVQERQVKRDLERVVKESRGRRFP